MRGDSAADPMSATTTAPRPALLRGRDDAGLGLVEVLVSMAILAIVLLAFVPVQVNALRTVVLSGERQQATAYANRAIEQVRARVASADDPTKAATRFTAVAAGRAPDLAAPLDRSNTTGCPGSGCTFTPSFDASFPAEPLLAGPSPDPVLSTQYCSKQSGCGPSASVVGVVFTTRLYITPTTSPRLINVTAVTAWTSQNSRAGVRQVAIRTEIAEPRPVS